MITTYKPSGKFDVSLFTYSAIGAVGLFALGIVYQLVVSWIPFIYLDAILTVCVGLGVGGLAARLISQSKCRNQVCALLSALLLSLAALAGSHYWGFYDLNHQLAELAKNSDEPESLQQLTVPQYISFRTNTGWNVSSHGGSSSSGPSISGYGVYAVWLTEALIILGFALYGAYDQVRSPYCERCGDWSTAPKVTVHRRSSVEKAGPKVKEAKTSDDLLLSLPEMAEGETPANFVYTVSKCLICADLDTLSVNMEYQKKNMNGKQETKKKTLWRHVLLSRTQTSAIEAENASATTSA